MLAGCSRLRPRHSLAISLASRARDGRARRAGPRRPRDRHDLGLRRHPPGGRSAAVFGVLNTMLKPLLRLVTLPLAILTFGLAWFFVSLLMLVITKAIVSGFYIHGFGTLIGATVIVWGVNLIRQ